MPWGWRPDPGSLASKAACAGDSAPCPPPPPPATTSALRDRRQRWSRPLAETECDQFREGSEPAAAARRTSSARPTEPRIPAPRSFSKAAMNLAAPTSLVSYSQFIHFTSDGTVLSYGWSVTIRNSHEHHQPHVFSRPRPDTEWKAGSFCPTQTKKKWIENAQSI